jgi:hypothetical protein
MSFPQRLLAAAGRDGTLIFPENQAALKSLTGEAHRLVSSPSPGGTLWRLPGENPSAGPWAFETHTGHAVFYGEHGRRMLCLDPGGTPLHECAWSPREQGPPLLLRARLQLDWGQWVGIKPEGLVNVARIDISKKPGWQYISREDLYRMASQAMGVAAEEVRFFYDEQNLSLDRAGLVTIRHRKDAFYILDDGRFDHPRFMACMSAMHWGEIDFLPVVELFQSLLPGTGSAAFELIRGLYDDQNLNRPPRLLRYRGIPTYPSPQAFQLFSTYFTPEAPKGADPFALFMDPARAADVLWRPRDDSPRRFMDPENGLCLTVMGGAVQKVTKLDDPAALPYTRRKGMSGGPGRGLAGRILGTTRSTLQLQDGERREDIPLRPEWGVTEESPLPLMPSTSQPTWRSLFPEGVPKLDPRQAYFAIPLYPEDDAPVEELATQPLVMEEVLEHLGHMSAGKASASVLIDQWDAVAAECIEGIGAHACQVLFSQAEFAQRQAQRVWDRLAGAGDMIKLQAIRFLPTERRATVYGNPYELILRWIPFEQYRDRSVCERIMQEIFQCLAPGGWTLLAGPGLLHEIAARLGLQNIASTKIADTHGAGMLHGILPKARVNPDATLFLFQKAVQST